MMNDIRYHYMDMVSTLKRLFSCTMELLDGHFSFLTWVMFLEQTPNTSCVFVEEKTFPAMYSFILYFLFPLLFPHINYIACFDRWIASPFNYSSEEQMVKNGGDYVNSILTFLYRVSIVVFPI